LRRELLLFVEGAKTEERYLTDWARRRRDRVLISIDPFRGTPRELVRKAVEAKKLEARDARRGRGRSHDEFWCVFDVDEHPHVREAVDLARRHDIGLAISNPCVELWFILHIEDRTAFIDRGDAQRRSKDLLGCGKNLTEEALALLYEHHDQAIARARQLDAKHAGDGSAPGSNPSSGMAALIDAVRGA
jgi:hypothetical protein